MCALIDNIYTSSTISIICTVKPAKNRQLTPFPLPVGEHASSFVFRHAPLDVKYAPENRVSEQEAARRTGKMLQWFLPFYTCYLFSLPFKPGADSFGTNDETKPLLYLVPVYLRGWNLNASHRIMPDKLSMSHCHVSITADQSQSINTQGTTE